MFTYTKLTTEKKALAFTSAFLVVFFLILWTDITSKFPGTIKIYDRNKTLLYEFSNDFIKSNISVKLQDIPNHLKEAAVVTEDYSFWSNPGFDAKAILRAVYFNIKGGREVSGASTITQQLARTTIFVDKPGLSRSYIKKMREILTAGRLNLFCSWQ